MVWPLRSYMGFMKERFGQPVGSVRERPSRREKVVKERNTHKEMSSAVVLEC